MKLMIAAGIGLAVLAGGSAYAYVLQGDTSGQLRATGLVGEQPDGYLGAVGSVSADVRAQMDAVNIQRRARYTQLASQRGATIEEVAAATACQLLSTRVGPGQYYRMPSGVWKRREGSEAVTLPGHCGQ